MSLLIQFETKAFNLDQEPENPFNPILGHSVGTWLAPLLKDDGLEVGEISPEDWGWFVDVFHKEDGYMLGFTAFEAQEDQNPEILIQIVKRRSFWERLTAKNKLTNTEPLIYLIKKHLEQLPIIGEIEFTSD